MLELAFQKCFALLDHGSVSVEKLLYSWLSLNENLSKEVTETNVWGPGSKSVGVVTPVIPLKPAAVGHLLSFLKRFDSVSVFLGFSCSHEPLEKHLFFDEGFISD
jgi:hypothetical protein